MTFIFIGLFLCGIIFIALCVWLAKQCVTSYDDEPERAVEDGPAIYDYSNICNAGQINNALPRYTEEVETHGGMTLPPAYIFDPGEPPPPYANS
uniref:Uncharacterized protein n=1 Tax=Acrobeloides nanus TaxID=290746 RepID=A0A914CGF7_9BILA